MILRALALGAVLLSAEVLAETPVISAHNIAGPAMSYNGLDFSAGAGEATGPKRVETKRGPGENGFQEALIGTPFTTFRRETRTGSSIVLKAPVPGGPVAVDLYFMET